MTSYDVIIVGAGLAGLRAAQVLQRPNLRVALLDAAPDVGGRVATDVVDGFVIDRGFQIINTAYPELRAAIDLSALSLAPFERGVVLHHHGSDRVVRDPRHHVRSIAMTIGSFPGNPQDLVRAGRLIARVSRRGVAHLETAPDVSTIDALRDLGFSTRMIEELWRPFLSGVLLRDDLATSWRFTTLALRSFVRGTLGVPAGGVRALPQLMAASLTTVDIHTSTRVRSVTAHSVTTDDDSLSAQVVIVATEAAAARRLLPDVSVPSDNGVTTSWFATPALHGTPILRLDLDGRRTTNMVEMSAASSTYAPPGKSLIAASCNGARRVEDEHRVVEDVARLYGLATSDVQLVARSEIPHALPDLRAPLALRRDLSMNGVLLAGDWTETPSIQGALVSGRRAARRALSLVGIF